MNPESEDSKLEHLQRTLYDRRQAPPPLRRSRLGALFTAGERARRPVAPLRRNYFAWLSLPRLKRILLWAILFFLVMAAITLFVFYRGKNLVSAGKVEIAIAGPLQTAAGQELDLPVTVTNHNNAGLELADLIVEYPRGTRVAGAVDQALTRQRLPLGTIAPGQTVRQMVRAILFGEKGSRQTINFRVEYRLADSNAIFDKAATYEIEIGSTPLVVLLDVPDEVNSNQEITLNLEIQSNAPSAIASPIVMIAYPAGFHFLSASPVPRRGDHWWQLNELRPGSRQTIRIRGTLEGQDEEQKSFRVSAGTADNEQTDELAAVYGSAFELVTIKRPFVELVATINDGAESEYLADSREPLRVEINWTNNLPAEIKDGQLTAVLTGEALDQSTVSPQRGFYNSAGNNIVWNKVTDPALASIGPGLAGRSSFSLASLSLASAPGRQLRQPALDLLLKFQGQRVKEGGQTETVYSELEKKIKFNSVVQLVGKALYQSGAFPNHGPLPPEVDQETTYTIVWSVLNSSNSLSGATVTGTLPAYVRWLGVTAPAGETASFQPDGSGGGQVIWTLGQVNPGTGTEGPARELSFQVALRPSLSQVGTTPSLLLDSVFSALDSFTKQNLTAKLKRDLDTQLVAEPQFVFGQDRVAQ